MQEAIKPVYHKAGNVRFPYTRYHAALSLYECSSSTASATAFMEDALYKSASMYLFAKLSLDQAIPDRATIMNFRHLLELRQLVRQPFNTINQWLSDTSIMMKLRHRYKWYRQHNPFRHTMINSVYVACILMPILVTYTCRILEHI
ncbi:hypothetical protein A6767_01955 [Aeromonas veronii]|nr:hypothetical protein A6767_01955 [Aeromonas veronii]